MLPTGSATTDFDPEFTSHLASKLLHSNAQFSGQIRSKRSLAALARVVIPIATGAISLFTLSTTIANLEASNRLYRQIQLSTTTPATTPVSLSPPTSDHDSSVLDSENEEVKTSQFSPRIARLRLRMRRSMNVHKFEITSSLKDNVEHKVQDLHSYFKDNNLSAFEQTVLKDLLASLVLDKLPKDQRQRLTDVTSAIAMSLQSRREKRAIGTLFAILIAMIVPMVTSVAVELPLSLHQAGIQRQQLEHQNNSTMQLLKRVEQLAAAQQSTSDQVLRLTTFLVKHGFPAKTAHEPAETIVNGRFDPQSEKVMDAVRRIEAEVDMTSWFDSITFPKSDDSHERKKRSAPNKTPHDDLLELREDLIISNEIFSQQTKLRAKELETFFNKTELDAKNRLQEASNVLYVTASLVSAFFLSLLILVAVMVYIFKTPRSRPLLA